MDPSQLKRKATSSILEWSSKKQKLHKGTVSLTTTPESLASQATKLRFQETKTEIIFNIVVHLMTHQIYWAVRTEKRLKFWHLTDVGKHEKEKRRIECYIQGHPLSWQSWKMNSEAAWENKNMKLIESWFRKHKLVAKTVKVKKIGTLVLYFICLWVSATAWHEGWLRGFKSFEAKKRRLRREREQRANVDQQHGERRRYKKRAYTEYLVLWCPLKRK